MHALAAKSPRLWRVAGYSLLLAGATFGQTPSASLTLDPHKALNQYRHESWQYDQGLPQNSVQALAQTPEGYLWLGLEEGLVRFEGVHFTKFYSGNTPALKYNNIMALCTDPDSSLWIGTNGGGLLHLHHGAFTAYAAPEGLGNLFIKSLFKDRQGRVWIGTNQGLYLKEQERIALYLPHHALSQCTINALEQDRNGRLWIGTNGDGLFSVQHDTVVQLTTAQGLSNNVVMALHAGSEGGLWIGTFGGLNLLRGGSFQHYGTRQGLAHASVRVLYEDRAGSLWIGTQGGGLQRMREGKFETFSTRDGLPHDIVRSLCEDREGSLWIGTYGGGLSRLREGKFANYSTRQGLSNDMVWSIYEDRAQNLWFGTDRGLNRFKDDKVTIFSTAQGLAPNGVVALHEDHAGNLWIGTEGGGLHRLAHGRMTRFTTSAGLSNDFVRAIWEDRNRNLWVATDRGLNLFQDGKFKVYTTQDGLANDELTYLYEDHAGALWIASRTGGMTRFQDGKFTTFTTAQGLSSNLVRVIYEDSSGGLWIGTNGGGLNLYKNGKFSHFTTAEGLFDDLIFQILEDRRGNFWMSCNNGIFRVSRRQLEEFAQGETAALSCVSYGKADGMLTNECNGGLGQPSGWQSHDGKLWFPTIAGVTMVDPENLKTNPLPPPVVLEEVTVDHKTFAVQPVQRNDLLLSPGSKTFEFHYTGLSLLAPQKVRFRYRLEGFEENWVEAGARRTAYYTNLPPGRYKFHVRACNNDGIWNEAGATLAFSLQPFFYQTTWFYSLVALTLVLGGAGALHFRLSQIQAREQQRALLRANEDLERRVHERTVELSRRSAELEESQNLLNSVIDNLPDMLFVKEADQLSFVRFNRAGEELLGLTQHEMLGKTDYDFFPWEQAEFFTSKDRQVLSSRQGIDISEEPIQSPKGARWLFTRKLALLGADQQPKYLLGISQDITERKQAEEEIRRLNAELEQRVDERTAELRESEGRFRQLAENINEVLWMEAVDSNRLIYVSPTYEKVWGRSCESLLQHPSTFLDSVYPEDRDRLRAHLSKQRRGEISETEYRIALPDGKVRWIWDRGFPIQNGDGHIYRSAGIAQDITARKLLEEQLRQYTEQLERLVEERTARVQELERQRAESEKLAATGRMAARIAHEINNPLAGIKNSFLLIKDAIPSSHRYYSYVGRIEKEIDRITNIVRQMFILYRPDPVVTHSFRVEEMIEDVVALLQTSCRERMVRLEMQAPSAPTLISKPEGLLRQVLYNVIQNAIEASPPQGQVTVSTHVNETLLTIAVADEGLGIPEAVGSQIFEPFFTTKDSQLTPGIGLGLSISKSIMEALHGSITYQSQPGQGTTFRLTLPLAD